jgi:hypothetical protein
MDGKERTDGSHATENGQKSPRIAPAIWDQSEVI